ncbi:methylated-DNA--[protein]-cysteine S-methyltransferase [Embleya sp. NPDC050154]|uniref:methylated-DNA--[protein]-cysteine S-methyltransferase n=1 Tax=unclassified Embleya TaxID=2699296 RepID=UPI00379601D7
MTDDNPTSTPAIPVPAAGAPSTSVLLARARSDREALDRLHDRLVAAAARDGLLDVAYTTVDTPIGSLLLAATDKGLVRVAFAGEDHDKVLDTLTARLGPRILRAPGRLARAARQLDEYFDHSRTSFDLDLDLVLSTGFRQLVQRRLPEIGYGHTFSYADVARMVGNPQAVRAVGSACASNPLPIVLPCHRVLRSDGTLGGYAGGIAIKSALLSLEAGP